MNVFFVLFLCLSLPSQAIQIFVKDYDGKTVALDVEPDQSILWLKRDIAEKIGIPPQYQRLICEGKKLQDDKKISDYNINKESSVYVLLQVP